MSTTIHTADETREPAGLPIAEAQPEVLELAARARGVWPASAADARVLEIHCGDGANLLPWAERYPRATFVGVDGSPGAIARARDAAGACHLPNVDVRAQDLRSLEAAGESFDYIVAHAVYSWVDAESRDKLLELCGRLLAPRGVAYVSFRTYPGSHVHDMLRAMMRFDARGAQSAGEQCAAGRRFLDFLKHSLVEKHPYDQLIKGEAAAVAALDDGYLAQDHLAPAFRPVYLREFLAHARQHGLQCIGDAAGVPRTRADLGPDPERMLAEITADPWEQEAFRDIVTGRAIRQAILVRSDAPLVRSFDRQTLASMHLECGLRPEQPLDLRAGVLGRFASPSGVRLSTPHPLAKAALATLGERWPLYVSWEDLWAESLACVEAAGIRALATQAESDRLADNLVQCCVQGAVRPHTQPASFVGQVGSFPQASPFARYQAARGEVVTTRRHEPMRLNVFDRQLLPLLDGTRNSEQLIDRLTAAVLSGQMVAREHGLPVNSAESARRVVGPALAEALPRLARSALLVG